MSWVKITWITVFLKAADLAEYTARIALLEEAKRVKEEEASEWQNRVSIQLAAPQKVFVDLKR